MSASIFQKSLNMNNFRIEKMVKRGQVSLFIFIGVIIILIVSLLYIGWNVKTEETPVQSVILTKFDSDTVRGYIDDCVSASLKDTLDGLGLQGGYYNPVADSLKYDMFGDHSIINVPYYMIDYEDRSPGFSEIQNQLSISMNNTLRYCTNRLPSYYNVEYSPDTVSYFDFSSNSVSIRLSQPIKIIFNSSVVTLDSFYGVVNSDYILYYNLSKKITEEQLKYGDYLCMSCINELANQNNVTLDTDEIELENDYVIIYSLYRPNSTLAFLFAHKFPLAAALESHNAMIYPIGALEATVGYNFEYDVSARGSGLTFSDDTNIFDIDPQTGNIRFTPTTPQVGDNMITITAKDSANNGAKESFVLKIKDVGSYPVIQPINYLSASAGVPFSYDIKAYSPAGLNLTYLDDSGLFNISSKNGTISFVPIPSQAGLHRFNITAIDANGFYSTEEGYIIIR